METNYYFPIDSSNLPHYFGSACIKPSKYFKNRNEDIQNNYNEYLLITSKMGTNQTDCSLELVLTAEEEKNLIPINAERGIFLFNKPLPITRVKSIYFNDEEVKDRIITAINVGTAFIPPIEVKVIQKMESVEFSALTLPTEAKSLDLSEQIKKYDRILGGFALMRLGGEEYMNYSTNYFSTLSFFNSVVATELSNLNKNINPIYHDIFVGKEKFKKLFHYLNKEITESDLEQLASEEKQKVNKNKTTGLIDISLLNHATYVLAVLYTYGAGEEARRKKIDGLIANNFKGEIKPDKSEIISLCYGLNRGYSIFSNKYKVSGVEKIVKFKLDSQLDYYTIESIYQFTFNEINQGGEFPYLDKWCPKLAEPKRIRKNEYLILDELIIGEIIKVGSAKWWSNFLLEFFQKEHAHLFKSSLEKFFNKINSDIRDEMQEEFDSKNDEIQNLQNENKKNELMIGERYRQQQKEIEFLKEMNAKLNLEYTNLRKELENNKQFSNSLNEPKIRYADKDEKIEKKKTKFKKGELPKVTDSSSNKQKIKDEKTRSKELNSNSTLPFKETNS